MVHYVHTKHIISVKIPLYVVCTYALINHVFCVGIYIHLCLYVVGIIMYTHTCTHVHTHHNNTVFVVHRKSAYTVRIMHNTYTLTLSFFSIFHYGGISFSVMMCHLDPLPHVSPDW